MSKLKQILELALNFEKSGQEFYKSNMESIKQALAKDTFGYLMEMESSHVVFIKKLILQNEEGSKLTYELKDEESDKFEDRLKSQALSDKSYNSDLADLSILRMAYLIEKDFVDYYEKASKEVESPEAKDLFMVLRDWEKGHVELVRTLMEKIYEKHSLDFGFYPY